MQVCMYSRVDDAGERPFHSQVGLMRFLRMSHEKLRTARSRSGHCGSDVSAQVIGSVDPCASVWLVWSATVAGVASVATPSSTLKVRVPTAGTTDTTGACRRRGSSLLTRRHAGLAGVALAVAASLCGGCTLYLLVGDECDGDAGGAGRP